MFPTEPAAGALNQDDRGAGGVPASGTQSLQCAALPCNSSPFQAVQIINLTSAPLQAGEQDDRGAGGAGAGHRAAALPRPLRR